MSLTAYILSFRIERYGENPNGEKMLSSTSIFPVATNVTPSKVIFGQDLQPHQSRPALIQGADLLWLTDPSVDNVDDT
jgi:hypothetical protein